APRRPPLPRAGREARYLQALARRQTRPEGHSAARRSAVSQRRCDTSATNPENRIRKNLACMVILGVSSTWRPHWVKGGCDGEEEGWSQEESAEEKGREKEAGASQGIL